MPSRLMNEFKLKFNDLVTINDTEYYFQAKAASRELNEYLKQYIFILKTDEKTENNPK